MIFKRKHKQPDYVHKDFNKSLKLLLGFNPKNPELYYRAFLHSSYANAKEHLYKKHNERLEFLGDLILDAIIGEFLFSSFPDMNEGALTKMKTRFVSRNTLNDLAVRLGLEKMIVGEFKGNLIPEDAKGNAFEALIGAIYLDKGFEITKKTVINKFFDKHLNMIALLSFEDDNKSKLHKWAQKIKKTLRFVDEEVMLEGQTEKTYSIQVFLDDEIIAEGSGKNKKSAEKNAAQDACDKLHL